MSERSLAIRQEIGTLQLADILAKSGYFSDARSQAQAVVKILAGAELDFGPIASMNGIHIIEGKPAMAANLIGAAIKRSPRYNYRIVKHSDAECSVAFYEQGEKVGESTFTMKDAQAAGLVGRKGDMWGKYPRNMLFARALANGARWYCPDIFSTGVYTPEELGADVDADGNPTDGQRFALGEVIDVEMKPPYVPTEVREVEDADIIRSADDKLWQRWMALVADANRWRVPVPREVKLGISRPALIEAGVTLKQQIDERQALLAAQDAERAAAQQAPAAPTAGQPAGAEAAPQAPSPWQRNQQLHLETYNLGLKLRELPVTASPEEIEQQNAWMEDWLQRQPSL